MLNEISLMNVLSRSSILQNKYCTNLQCHIFNIFDEYTHHTKSDYEKIHAYRFAVYLQQPVSTNN